MNDNTKFWLRIVFYVLILGALIYVGLSAGGDPCERCKLKVEQIGDKEYSCRDIIDEFVVPKYGVTNNGSFNGQVSFTNFEA